MAQAHDIAEGKRSAFHARLQHLQKLKFPAGLNTGRGRAATYTVGHIYLIGVALELLQIGLNPERAKRVIEEDLHSVAMAASLASQASYTLKERKFDSPTLLYCDPAALRELTTIYQEEDWASQTFFYTGLEDAKLQMAEWFCNGVQRIAFFSVSALVYDLTVATLPQTHDMSEFCALLNEWADPFVHNVTYDLNRPEQPYWQTLIEELEDGD